MAGSFFLCLLILLSCDSYPSVSYEVRGGIIVPVVEVHDGDTVSVMLGGKKERVRCIGIDAPELGQIPWGERASAYMVSLLGDAGWRVELELDVERRDKYGRLLAYLRTADGRILNQSMLEKGYAVLFTVPPNVKYSRLFAASQKAARLKKLGIWGEGGLSETPRDYRRSNPRR